MNELVKEHAVKVHPIWWATVEFNTE